MRLISIAVFILAVSVSAAQADTSYGGAVEHAIPQHGKLPGSSFKHREFKGGYRHPYANPYYGFGYSPYPFPYRYSEPHFGYFPYRLGYRYGRTYYGDGGYFKTEPYVYAPPKPIVYSEQETVVEVTEAPKPALPQSTADAAGWVLIAEGNYPEAIRVFGDASIRQPHAGSPKIGYALSVALGGDLGTGVWAMRKAAAIDPQALSHLYPDAQVAARVAEVRELYQQRFSRDGDPDAAFMVASLSYLAGDANTARLAIERAVQAGDNAQSTQQLLNLLGSAEPVSASGG